MTIIFDETGSVANLRQSLAQVVDAGARTIQILGAIGNDWQPDQVDPILAPLTVPVFGGLFPGVIFEGATYSRGTLVMGLDLTAQVAVVDCTGDIPPADGWAPRLASAQTIIAYLDATCPTGGLVRALFRALGSGPTWLGGGAGALDFIRRPVVITPQGLRAGVAVLAGLDARARLAVTHGWTAFGDAMLVTEARGNDIVSLDWRPAFEVYREVVERHAQRSFDEEGFFGLASTYPLMVERLSGEGIVRDPLAVLPDGAIRCAGDIQPNATVRVANGDRADMLRAAHAAQAHVSAPGISTDGITLTIDCISRALLLGEDIRAELAALRLPVPPQAGALTIGEVAGSGDGFLEVHNKTTVLACIPSTR